MLPIVAILLLELCKNGSFVEECFFKWAVNDNFMFHLSFFLGMMPHCNE